MLEIGSITLDKEDRARKVQWRPANGQQRIVNDDRLCPQNTTSNHIVIRKTAGHRHTDGAVRQIGGGHAHSPPHSLKPFI